MYSWAYASVSTGPHTHKQQTHSPNISVFCVWVLQAKRLCVNDNARDSIATGDSMSMLTFFYVFHLKFVAVFFLCSSPIDTCVYWCCVVFVWKVWLFLKNYFYFFLRFDFAGPLKISNGSGIRQRQSEKAQAIRFSNCRQLVFLFCLWWHKTLRFKCLAEGEWVCDVCYTHSCHFCCSHILRGGGVCGLFLSLSHCCCHFLWTTAPIRYWHRYRAIQNLIMSIGFIVAHLCSVHGILLFTRMIYHTQKQRCYYSCSLSTALHKM